MHPPIYLTFSPNTKHHLNMWPSGQEATQAMSHDCSADQEVPCPTPPPSTPDSTPSAIRTRQNAAPCCPQAHPRSRHLVCGVRRSGVEKAHSEQPGESVLSSTKTPGCLGGASVEPPWPPSTPILSLPFLCPACVSALCS